MKPCITRKENGKRMTSQNFKSEEYPPMRTSGVLDSPARTSPLQGKQRGLVGKRSGIYYNIIDLLKGKEESAKPTYLLVENVKNLLSINAGFDFASVLWKWTKQGMTVGGRCLIPKISESRRIGSACSLSQILEAEVDGNTTSQRRKRSSSCQTYRRMQGYRVYGTDGISVTLVGNAGGIRGEDRALFYRPVQYNAEGYGYHKLPDGKVYCRDGQPYSHEFRCAGSASDAYPGTDGETAERKEDEGGRGADVYLDFSGQARRVYL